MNSTPWTEQTGPASVLKTLSRGDWLPTFAVAERSGVKKCTVTSTLNRLRDMGLIIERQELGGGRKEWRTRIASLG